MKFNSFLLSALIASGLAFTTTATTAYANSGYDNGYYNYDGQGKQHKGKRAGRHNKSPEQRVEKMAQRLGLSESQKQQVLSITQSRQGQIKALRDQMKSVKQSMRSLDPASPNYVNDLNNYANQKADLVRQMTIAKGQKRQAIFSVLTPEQQAKAKQMKDRRAQKRWNRQNQQ